MPSTMLPTCWQHGRWTSDERPTAEGTRLLP